ncbi:hypothetical protein CDS [Bradyrhizobium sp.]|nr:hypothetical protein CDS [Bradyrhizobium sp.]
MPARASPDGYRGRRDLLPRLFELIKVRIVLRCPNLAHVGRLISACEGKADVWEISEVD